MRALSMFLYHCAKAIFVMTLSVLAHGTPILEGQRLGGGKLRVFVPHRCLQSRCASAGQQGSGMQMQPECSLWPDSRPSRVPPITVSLQTGGWMLVVVSALPGNALDYK